MKQFWRVNIYEMQAILYWILGVLILHLGTWHWLGWLSIGWGWFTFGAAVGFGYTYRDTISGALD